MAKTFYGYAEREAGSYVDWSQIGKDITDMLQEEVVRRESLKKELEDASTAFGETLANSPGGMHQDTTDAITKLASNVQQQRLLDDRLLKSGQLNPRNYVLNRENMVQGTKQMFDVKKKFEEVYQDKVNRLTNGEMSEYEMALFLKTEGFANFTNADFYINPTNGKISAGKKIEKKGPNGKVYYEMSREPGDNFTMPELMAFTTAKVDPVNLDDVLAKKVELLGDIEQTITYKGKLITIKDASQQVIYKSLPENLQKVVDRSMRAINAAVEDIISDPFQRASIASDNLRTASNGKKYRYVWSEEEAEKNPEAIFLKRNLESKVATPEVGDLDHVRKQVKNRFLGMIDQKYEEKTEFRPDWQKQKYFLDKKDKKEQVNSFLTDWVVLASGGYTEGQSKSAGTNVRNNLQYKGQEIVKMQKTVDKSGKPVVLIKVRDDDGNIKDITPIPLQDKKTYIRAIRALLPDELSKEVSDKELEKMGLNVWKDDGKNAFNAFNVTAGISKTIDDPSTMTIKYDDKTYQTLETAADAISEINGAGLKGIFGTSNKKKREILVEVQNKQTEAINQSLQDIGENPINLTTNSDNQYGIFTNGNNQVKIEFADATGLPAAQNLFHSAILKYGAGSIDESELKDEAEQFLKGYREAMVKNYTKNAQSDGLIIIGGNARSINYLQDKKIGGGFEELVDAMKGLARKTGRAGGAMSSFN
jgi:hypothetical protein